MKESGQPEQDKPDKMHRKYEKPLSLAPLSLAPLSLFDTVKKIARAKPSPRTRKPKSKPSDSE
jgi:hypothetical protein